MKKKQILPLNFKWRTYLKLNPDLNQSATKTECIQHYLNYGIKENRQYKTTNFLYKLMRKNKINFNDNLFDICCILVKYKTKLENNINKFKLIKLYTNIQIDDIDVHYNNINKNFLISPIYTSNDIDINLTNQKIQIKYKETQFLNIYDSFILIVDLPEGFTGGSKFFINEIINKYKKEQAFLCVYKTENDLVRFNINNTYFFNYKYTIKDALDLIIKCERKITKVFINHTYGFPSSFIEKILTLNCKVSTITHDHYLFMNSTQLMVYDINKSAYNLKYDLNLFENIITQNKQNLYLFKKSKENLSKNVVVCDLPDYKYSDDIIISNNEYLVIGIIGTISTIKGAVFVKFLTEYFKNDNVKIIIFGKVCDLVYNHCYSYNNIDQFNELLKIHKPNLLIETSLWPETYSFTLTLAMLTDLPILVLQKSFQSVIEDRLSKYNKSHYFNTFNQFLSLIYKVKQNYLKTPWHPFCYCNSVYLNGYSH